MRLKMQVNNSCHSLLLEKQIAAQKANPKPITKQAAPLPKNNTKNTEGDSFIKSKMKNMPKPAKIGIVYGICIAAVIGFGLLARMAKVHPDTISETSTELSQDIITFAEDFLNEIR